MLKVMNALIIDLLASLVNKNLGFLSVICSVPITYFMG
jgi:hypothetical protein